MSTDSNTVLSAQGLVMKFGGITATNNVTLNLHKGARHALIGPNGAGKTTLINLLTGVLQPTAGKIILEGQDIPCWRHTSASGAAWCAPSRSTSCSTR